MEKRLSKKQTIVVACTLFGMFFGADNLIFPVHPGQLAGSNTLAATISAPPILTVFRNCRPR